MPCKQLLKALGTALASLCMYGLTVSIVSDGLTESDVSFSSGRPAITSPELNSVYFAMPTTAERFSMRTLQPVQLQAQSSEQITLFRKAQ